jgi:hypothetical protein
LVAVRVEKSGSRLVELRAGNLVAWMAVEKVECWVGMKAGLSVGLLVASTVALLADNLDEPLAGSWVGRMAA